MRATAFFIDGFNLYHSLDNQRHLRKYKWLNLWKFAESLLLPNDALIEVNYFTAYTDWNPARMQRHQDYVFLNENAGCKVILGKFFRKDRIWIVSRSILLKDKIQSLRVEQQHWQAFQHYILY